MNNSHYYEIEEYTTFEGASEEGSYFVIYTIDNQYRCVRYLQDIDTYGSDIDESKVIAILESYAEEDLNKPLINDCGKMLKGLYTDVYYSDSGMRFVEYPDEKYQFISEYGDFDLEDWEKLQNEVDKYNIYGAVEYYGVDDDWKMIGYCGLLEPFKWDYTKEM